LVFYKYSFLVMKASYEILWISHQFYSFVHEN
jgi:hypothetical protein